MNKDFDILEYWACATNKYPNFTYGKIYRVTIVANTVEIVDDRGLRFITRSNIDIIKFSTIRDKMEFILLNEWRNKKLEQIGI